MVVIDATTLLLLLRPNTLGPADANGIPISQPKERIEHLVQQLDKAKTKIVIPTPALSEILVRAGAEASQQIVDHLQRYAVFKIEPFDTRCAIEVAAMARAAMAAGSKKGAATAATYAKVKYDRQIVAVAKVCGATVIYTDDGDIRALVADTDIEVIGVGELPLPPTNPQHEMEFAPVDQPPEFGDDDDEKENR